MSAEQFQHENISWIFEKFNRDYYILLAVNDFEHRPLLDAESAVKEMFGLSADEYIMVLLMVFGLSKLNPIPLGVFIFMFTRKQYYSQNFAMYFCACCAGRIAKNVLLW